MRLLIRSLLRRARSRVSLCEYKEFGIGRRGVFNHGSFYFDV
jgi:hypothetical protein